MGRVLEFLPELFAFGFGLLMAWVFDWHAADLIWSLWLSSLVLGYTTILSTIAGGVFVGWKASRHPEFPADKKGIAYGIGGGAALFFLVFFSLHFCGFHAGHATFLQSFYPLQAIADSDNSRPFMSAFMNPLALWATVLEYVVPLYGIFLIPMLIVERREIFEGWNSSQRIVREITSSAGEMENSALGVSSDKGDSNDGNQGPAQRIAGNFVAGRANRSKRRVGRGGDAFTKPYKNVIKMHLLIFVLAGFSAIQLDNIWVYAFVSALYFFPWRAMSRTKTTIPPADDSLSVD
ncbi:MAG TPA: DUF6498-containing protein [Marinagarivorans sp.]